MKNVFIKIKDWFKNHMPTKRRLIQVYAALLYNANIKGFITGDIFKGDSKHMCVPGLNCYSCPGAIGACPLGSLQNALAASDKTVPTYVLGIILLFGLTLGRTICGALCPMGLLQELLFKLKTPKIKKSNITRAFSYLKYVILVVFVVILPIMYMYTNIPLPAFCKYICPAGIVEGAVSMVKMAIDQLADNNVVELDEERKAAMVSNLLVVLCSDESAQPVVNAGTLHH